MTEYKPGQRLTPAHDAWPAPLVWTVYRDGRYIEHPGLGGMFLHQLEEGVSITHVDGYPVPETPPLPTEPGLYRSGSATDVDGTVRLLESGRWEWVGNHYRTNPENLEVDGLGVHMPLQKLMTLDEARPTIAAEVIDWIDKAPHSIEHGLSSARNHFGVSE